MSNIVPIIYTSRKPQPRRCLSCGTAENMARRRYCSIACRQKLRNCLNMRSGLLKALNIRYATFYFTPALLIMDMVPFYSRSIYSFFYGRSTHRKPVEDFKRMFDTLGNIWWAEKKRTNKAYLASRHVLEKALCNHCGESPLAPVELKIPAVRGSALILLKLRKSDLAVDGLHEHIKRAYRRQAKRCHPDQGGNAETFRRIHQAYTELALWAENPTYVNRRGFPGKWFYNGYTHRWVQPTPRRNRT